MKDLSASTAVVAAIAGTTAKTLDKTYDAPTLRRQERLVKTALGPLAVQLTVKTGAQTACNVACVCGEILQ